MLKLSILTLTALLFLSAAVKAAVDSDGKKVPNFFGRIERSVPIQLNSAIIDNIRSLLLDSKGRMIPSHIPPTYDYISGVLRAKALGGEPNIDFGTVFWFTKASDINKGEGPSAIMIRSYTRIGIQLAGRTVPDLQKVSNNIAAAVLGTILKTGTIPPLYEVLEHDISGAMKLGNIKDIAGWGGSFYYWDMPMISRKTQKPIIDPQGRSSSDYLTIGDFILRNPDMRNRFIKTNVGAMMKVNYLTAASDPGGMMEALSALAKLPKIVKEPILNSIYEQDIAFWSMLIVFS